MEQLSLFDTYIYEDYEIIKNNPLKEISDEFIRQVDNICQSQNKFYKEKEVNYGVWSHVKNLGERLEVVFDFDIEKSKLHDTDTWFSGIGKKMVFDFNKIEELEKKYACEITIYAQWHLVILYTIYNKYNKKTKKEKEEE